MGTAPPILQEPDRIGVRVRQEEAKTGQKLNHTKPYILQVSHTGVTFMIVRYSQLKYNLTKC